MGNRFRAVEMGIFAVVSLIFLNSVYSLFMDGKFAGESERRPLAAQPEPRGTASVEQREPASAAAGDELVGFVPYETRCRSEGETFETPAAKVRILGPFCGAPTRPAAEGQYRIENTTARFSATVFSDSSSGKFSTDFIPLEPGPNRIRLDFKYRGSRSFASEVVITRKPPAAAGN